MDLVLDEYGALVQVDYELVDHDEEGPVFEPYALVAGPPRPGSYEHRLAIAPYVLALLDAFSQAPEDITF